MRLPSLAMGLLTSPLRPEAEVKGAVPQIRLAKIGSLPVDVGQFSALQVCRKISPRHPRPGQHAPWRLASNKVRLGEIRAF